jgi:hypothetical protein
MPKPSGTTLKHRWTRWQFWRSAIDVSPEELGALLRRALIVDADVIAGEDGSIDFVLLEIHHDGEATNRMLRLAAHGVHTEGWIIAEGRQADV